MTILCDSWKNTYEFIINYKLYFRGIEDLTTISLITWLVLD